MVWGSAKVVKTENTPRGSYHIPPDKHVSSGRTNG